MPAEVNLRLLIASMRPVLRDGTFVFATLPPGRPVPPGVEPVMTFREDEGLTVIAPDGQAEAAGVTTAFRSRMITLSVHSALDAVGFLAAVTTRLAEAGVSVNPVSGYHHDHLFVPADQAECALECLRRMSREACE